jgi:hypothetical protein
MSGHHPAELIHPGDRPRISRITSNNTKPVDGSTGVVFATTSAWLTKTGHPILPRRTARIAKRSTAHRVAAKGCGRPHHINGVLRPACGSKWPGARRVVMIIVSQCFWAERRRGVTRCRSRLSCGRCWAVTFPGRVPPPACRRRCPAGYGQSRRALGPPFGSTCAK